MADSMISRGNGALGGAARSDVHRGASRRAQWMRLVGAVALLVLACAGLGGCASGRAGEVGYVAPPTAIPENANASANPGASKVGAVVGKWEGVTLANCSTSEANRCNAEQKISLTMIEGDNGLTGYYRCAYGTINCYNMNETGKIVKGSLNGAQMTARVAMPDGTSCIFTGRTVNANAVTGGYSCYGGGALIESGSWQGRRTY